MGSLPRNRLDEPEVNDEDTTAVVGRSRLPVNLANSLSSTGPKTTAGLKRSKMNALQHGMDAKEIILPQLGETEEDWHSHLAGIVERWRPRDTYDLDLVVEVAEIRWLRRRVRRYRRVTTMQAYQSADRIAMSKLNDGDWDTSPDMIRDRACLPDNRSLEKADRHEARLLRRLQALAAELRQARRDGPVDVTINTMILLALLADPRKFTERTHLAEVVEVIENES